MVGVVAVDGQHGEDADELDALLQLGLQVGLADVVIVAGEGEHTAGQRVHQVAAGGFHDDVPHKVGGQVAAFDQAVLESIQLGLVGQVTDKEQVGGFLKGIALAAQAPDEVIHVVAAVPEFSVAGHFFTVLLLKGINAGDVGNACQHAFAVLVAQAAFDVVLAKKGRVDAVVGDTFLGKNGSFFCNSSVIAHGYDLLFFCSPVSRTVRHLVRVSSRFFPGYELFLYVAYILNYTVRLYGLSNKVFMNKLYKTAKMSHNAKFALQDIFARLEDYMERKRKEEMFIENAGLGEPPLHKGAFGLRHFYCALFPKVTLRVRTLPSRSTCRVTVSPTCLSAR